MKRLSSLNLSLLLAVCLVQPSESLACTYSTDCPSLCDKSMIIPRECSFTNNTCVAVPTMAKDCSLQKPYEFTTYGRKHSISQTCLLTSDDAVCGNHKSAALSELTTDCIEVSYKFDEVSQQRQLLEAMRQESVDICLHHAANLTANLIVTGAFAVVTAGAAGAVSSGTSLLTIANTLVSTATDQLVTRTIQTQTLTKASNRLKNMIKKVKKGNLVAADYCGFQEDLRDDIIPAIEISWNALRKEAKHCRGIRKEIEKFPDSVKRPIDLDLDPPVNPKPPVSTKPPVKKPVPPPSPNKKPTPVTPKKCVKDPTDKGCEPDSHPEIPLKSPNLQADFSCGRSFELSPNDILYPHTCYVEVTSNGSTADKVKINVLHNTELIDVTFDQQIEAPKYPHNRFLLIIRTRETAPPSITTMVIIVRQGTAVIRIPVTISILEAGIEPSSGPGIRPAATIETGSGGPFCVWRYKSFGDKPKCFNIDTAACDDPEHIDKPKYELVGSDLSAKEAALRAFVLSPYKGDAYGCFDTPDKDGDKHHDGDYDSIPDNDDNCPTTPNKNQMDSDSDGTGDVCDTDKDNDGIENYLDNCPAKVNSDQKDADGDGIGDICDLNNDNDNILDAQDNCKYKSNPSQDDLDGDGSGDACDTDKDGDDQQNNSDNCPLISNPAQTDKDADGQGDACDMDRDGDGKRNGEDNCPDTANPDQKNSDSHWMGDACMAPTATPGGANVDCTAHSGTMPVWDEDKQSYGCVCQGDKDWSDALNRCATLREDSIAKADCSAYGSHVKPVWDEAVKQIMCECQAGYKFDQNNMCQSVDPSDQCADFPGTALVNNQCECTGNLNWSDTLGRCVKPADLTQNDIDCTPYPGSIPLWNNSKNSWQCQCLGSKHWSDSLHACVYDEDEAVAAANCSAYPDTTAEWDDFTGSVVCKCNKSGVVLSNVIKSCMSPEAAAVADHDCSSYGPGAKSIFDAPSQQARCDCKGGYHFNSDHTECLSDSTTALTPSTGQIPPPPETVVDSTCDATSVAGNSDPISHRFDVTGVTQITLVYDTEGIMDRIRVLTSSGTALWDSGCVGTRGNKTEAITVPPGSNEIYIDVHPNCKGDTGTHWSFTASCQ